MPRQRFNMSWWHGNDMPSHQEYEHMPGHDTPQQPWTALGLSDGAADMPLYQELPEERMTSARLHSRQHSSVPRSPREWEAVFLRDGRLVFETLQQTREIMVMPPEAPEPQRPIARVPLPTEPRRLAYTTRERSRNARTTRVPRWEPTYVPDYLLELCCGAESPSLTRCPYLSPEQLARFPPNRMLRYDNRSLILPDDYLHYAPRQSIAPYIFVLQLLNPYQLERVQSTVGGDILFAIEDGNAEYAMITMYKLERSVMALRDCALYVKHLHALKVLAAGYGLCNPYKGREYRMLMSGWEGYRRAGWSAAERRKAGIAQPMFWSMAPGEMDAWCHFPH
ncbi:uncharacterized protein CLAFUR5_13271 [Fulvia fulva]|uniref:Uncharacterized protein n=1 Tax=Passalora fulva TaxID=5499 RepID=A0A9Q8UVI2_PASFU|nr:uncharacterized protein CLAFUR5_13271 [Fulvia fulva]KAK4612543.1 hypothetical protein CLAFUR0_13428 [Fulvia fulva]UJO24024.1 hypothetical protein CLAFUR5_13271 [Fulvia fulva]